MISVELGFVLDFKRIYRPSRKYFRLLKKKNKIYSILVEIVIKIILF